MYVISFNVNRITITMSGNNKYEKEREQKIALNNARIEALGLRPMIVTSSMKDVGDLNKPTSVDRNDDEDVEYFPGLDDDHDVDSLSDDINVSIYKKPLFILCVIIYIYMLTYINMTFILFIGKHGRIIHL